mgnify:CR=1 FL=1
MKTNVAVFFGGRSVEHEISVISALQAIHAFDADKYNVIPVYISKQGRWYTGPELLEVRNYRDMKKLTAHATEVYMRPEFGDYSLYRAEGNMWGKKAPVVARLDVSVPVLHGTNGEDGIFEGVLQTIGLPFAGCDVLASANGMDKITMKMILRSCGVPVVDYVWFTDGQWRTGRQALIEQVERELGYPVIVKPANLGSSVGIGKAADRKELEKAVDNAERFSSRLIVEHMVGKLKEINCSVLGDADDCRPSVCEEPVKTGDFLSYEDKYMGGGKGGSKQGMQSSERRVPADLPDEVTRRIQHLACETFRSLGCHGVSRVDVMIDEEDGQIYVNEINTIPGSLSFYLWEATGLSFPALMDELVRLAFDRKRKEELKTFSFDNNIFAMGGAIGAKGSKGTKF